MQRAAFYVGLDWGSERHAICVTRNDGRIVKERFVPNDATALLVIEDLTSSVARSDVVIGVETRHLTIVDALIARGFRVSTINPKKVDRFRERHSVAGAKDDRLDARVIASALMTDEYAFDVVVAEGAEQRMLRATSRVNEANSEIFRATASRLYQQVLAAAPSLLKLCSGADEPWFWDLFLDVVRSMEMVVDDERIGAILKEHRIRRFTVAAVRAQLSVNSLELAPGAREAILFQATHLVSLLRHLHATEKAVTRAESEALDALPKDKNGNSDADIVRSLPGFANKTTAALLVEANQAVANRNAQQLRALAGVAPVKKSTGKKQQQNAGLVVMRRSVSTRLRNAMHHAANTARRAPRFSTIYENQRSHGKSHGRACRAVGDRLVSTLMAMLISRELYRPPI